MRQRVTRPTDSNASKHGKLKSTYRSLLLLRLGSIIRGALVGLGSVAIGLSLGDFPGNSLAASPAGSPLGFFLLLLLVFLIRRFGNLDNYLTAIELLFVEEFDGLLCSLWRGQSNETIARRASTSEDDLGREAKGRRNELDRTVGSRLCMCHVHITLNRRKERLQPVIRSGIRKIARKDLKKIVRMDTKETKRNKTGIEAPTLKPGASSTLSCVGGTPFSVTGAAWASDMVVVIELVGV
jgi:hypothetical protein